MNLWISWLDFITDSILKKVFKKIAIREIKIYRIAFYCDCESTVTAIEELMEELSLKIR